MKCYITMRLQYWWSVDGSLRGATLRAAGLCIGLPYISSPLRTCNQRENMLMQNADQKVCAQDACHHLAEAGGRTRCYTDLLKSRV